MTSQAAHASLFGKLKASKRLPSPPGTALRVLELCRNEIIDIQEIADAIMSDPALSGRLLKFANSPIAGLNREIASIREAVMMLGLRTVMLTALGFSIAMPEFPAKCPGFELKNFWSKSFATATIARLIAKRFIEADPEEAFTAGVLSAIGTLALAQGLPDEYAAVLVEVDKGVLLHEAEYKVLGMDHAQFGAQLLADWELPELLVRAVADQLRDRNADIPPLSNVVRVASRLAPLFVTEGDLHPEVRRAAVDVVETQLRIDEPEWKQVSEEILAEYLQVAEVFDVKLEGQASVLDLYAEAQEEASRVGVVAQLERTKAIEDNKDLLRRATTDQLTGIANRAKFDERIEEQIKGARRGHGDFALIMIDIDHFKRFNDKHGHQVGDLVLKRVATAVNNSLRDVDLMARYGGEEFVIIAPQTDRKGACIVAARVRRCVEELRIEANGELLGVTISLGLGITTDYDTPPSAEKLIADADAQLYLSKDAGRNTWSYLGRSANNLQPSPTPASA